jgi:hypothetical protein
MIFLEVNSWIMSLPPPFSQQYFLFSSLVANFHKLVVIFGENLENKEISRKIFKRGGGGGVIPLKNKKYVSKNIRCYIWLLGIM